MYSGKGLNLDLSRVEAKPTCKGLVYRGYVSVYATRRGIESKSSLRLLRRKSCRPGCEQCGATLDFIQEEVAAEVLKFPEEIEDGALYQPIIANDYMGGYHWDSYEADYWVEFKKIKETQ